MMMPERLNAIAAVARVTGALPSLAVAWATLFVIGTDLFVVSPLLPQIAADYRMSVSTGGWAVTSFSLAYMLGAPLLGQLADRLGPSRMAAAGLVAFALANALTAAAPDFAALVAIRAVAGLSACAVTPSIYAMLGAMAPPARRATWLAIAVSGLLLALTLGAPLGEMVGSAYGWRLVFIALALLALAAVPLNRMVWPARQDSIRRALSLTTLAAIARRIVPTVIWSTALYAVYTYLGAGLAAQGADARAVAGVLLLYGAGALAGTFMGGRLADRFGSRKISAISLLGLAAAFLALGPGFSLGVPVTLPTAIGFGVASVLAQLFFPAQQAMLATDFPEHRAAALAWNNSALFLGISLGAAVGGTIFGAGGFATVIITSAVIALAGAALLPFLAMAGRVTPEVSRDTSIPAN
jgi:MFS transporter, DHA1 family, putative efflux transporter